MSHFQLSAVIHSPDLDGDFQVLMPQKQMLRTKAPYTKKGPVGPWNIRCQDLLITLFQSLAVSLGVLPVTAHTAA